MIYKLLLKSETSTVEPRSDVKRLRWTKKTGSRFLVTWSAISPGIFAAICHTNRIIAAESLPVLYGINTFIFSTTDIWTFVGVIGTNRLFINRASLIIPRYICPIFRELTEDEILEEVNQHGRSIERLEVMPNLRHLTIETECMTSHKCTKFRKALIADDSDFVIALFELGLKKIVELKIHEFPPELVKRIADFWESGEKFVNPSEPEISQPPPAKPVRPLPPHACLSCHDCKCGKPPRGPELGDLHELRKSLEALQEKMTSGVLVRADGLDASIKLIQEFTEKPSKRVFRKGTN